MKAQDGEKPREYAREYFSVPVLFDESREYEAAEMEKTAPLQGTAYHAFLEHFDFLCCRADTEKNFCGRQSRGSLAE
ncbi:MAG: hypothetical protein ACLR06_06850 [Christensenellaceae bacterium]